MIAAVRKAGFEVRLKPEAARSHMPRAIVELRAPQWRPDSSGAAFGDAARYVDLFNVYVPYTRRLAGAFPKGL